MLELELDSPFIFIVPSMIYYGLPIKAFPQPKYFTSAFKTLLLPPSSLHENSI
jgi:hypothetical protein